MFALENDLKNELVVYLAKSDTELTECGVDEFTDIMIKNLADDDGDYILVLDSYTMIFNPNRLIPFVIYYKTDNLSSVNFIIDEENEDDLIKLLNTNDKLNINKVGDKHYDVTIEE